MNRLVKYLCVFVLSFSPLVNAQVSGTGLYAFGSFDSKGTDTINIGNLNVHLDIPVLHKAGRGIPFAYDLVYDGLIWQPVTVAGVQSWMPAQNFGWVAQTVVMTGYVSYATHTYVCDWPPPKHGNFSIYDTWVYHDTFGGSHPFDGQLEYDPTGCDTTTTSFDATANDASGFTLHAAGTQGHPAGTQTITTSRGGSMVVPIGPASAGSSITDSNGNQVSVSVSGIYTDTLGTSVMTVSGVAPNNVTLTYPNASGGTSSYTVKYSTYTVQTNFGCNGIGEYTGANTPLLSEIDLPDGSDYTFTYEPSPSLGNGSVTGRLASLTLPTGGTVSYSYSGGCPGGASGLTRTTTDGSNSYTKSYSSSSSGNGTATTVQDEQGNQSFYQFSGWYGLAYETHRQIYQDALGGTPLFDQATCYNGASSPCDGVLISPPIAQTNVVSSYNGSSPLTVATIYDSSGMPTSVQQLSGSTVLETVSSTYNSLEEPLTITTYDGSGTPATYSYYGYDETTPTATSGIPQHSAVSGTRGNQTSAHVSASSSYLSTTTAYYDTGVPVSTTTPNGTTQYGYEPTQTFATTTTLPTPSSGVQLSTSASYDQQSGVKTSATGMNSGQTTQVTQYDSLLRPTVLSLPNGGEITASYSPNQTVVNQTIGNGETAVTATLMDAYGRKSRVAVLNGQSTNPWYQTDYCYDASGQLQFHPVSYEGNGWSTPIQCSGNGTSFTYDALGRMTSSTNTDGSTSNQYWGRAVLTTDVNGVQKITQYDLLGRIAGICEISSSTSQGAPGPCSNANITMDIAGTGFLTIYSYDLANHMTTITQGEQTRIFQTDAVGRTTFTSEPERGVTNYSYVYNATGLQVTRTRPQANQTNPSHTTTTTQYDSIGRVISVQYLDNGLTALTPNKQFDYDAVNSQMQWTQTPANVKGLLADTASGSGANLTRGLFSYDLMGNVTTMWQCAPSICGTSSQSIRPALTFSYDLTGNLTNEFDGVSGSIAYGRSPAGEVTSITNQSYTDPGNAPNLVSNIVNGPNGPITYDMGNGISASRTYDSLGRLSLGILCPTASKSNCYNTQMYGFYVVHKGAQVAGSCDDVLGQCVSYGYDEFNRLTSLSGTQSFSYVYDRYGNRTQQNAPQGGFQSNYSFNTATNQNIGLVYDAAGNVTYDGNHNYTYDAEGNILQVDGGSTAQYVYDALNRRVRVQTASSTYEYLFDYVGRRISSWFEPSDFGREGRIYWGNQQIAYRAWDGTTYFDHQDWNGTERMRTNYNGVVSSSYASLPWGDGYTPNENDPNGNAQDNLHFAMLDHDSESFTEHAQFRQYNSTQGRWMSPDPYDGSYDPNNPQSFNRYSYVRNNPLGMTDPSGLTPLCLVTVPDTETISEETTTHVDGTTTTEDNVTITPGYSDCSNNGIPSVGTGNQTTAGQPGPVSGGAPSTGKYHCPLFGPCYRGPALPPSCFSQALSKDGNGWSLLGDAAGFIPGEKLFGATAGVITMVGIGVGSTFNSAVHGDVKGTLAGGAGTQLAAIAPAAKYAGISFAESIPGVGTLLNVGVTARDGFHTYQAWQGCMTGHE